jgi:hypothetical protein
MNSPETSFSVSAFARIPAPHGGFFLLRNKSTLRKTGNVLYTPIGGAVEVPQGLCMPVSIWDLCPDPEREIIRGWRDLRYRLRKPAHTDAEQAQLREGIHGLTANQSRARVSLLREIYEELVDEEGIVKPEDLPLHTTELTFSHNVIQSEPNRDDPELGNRVYAFQVFDAQLPSHALSALIKRERTERGCPEALLTTISAEEINLRSRTDISMNAVTALFRPEELA